MKYQIFENYLNSILEPINYVLLLVKLVTCVSTVLCKLYGLQYTHLDFSQKTPFSGTRNTRNRFV